MKRVERVTDCTGTRYRREVTETSGAGGLYSVRVYRLCLCVCKSPKFLASTLSFPKGDSPSRAMGRMCFREGLFVPPTLTL